MFYTSRAAELGRGNKVTRFTDAPIDTPAPGTYEMKSDFVNQKKENELNPPPRKTNLDGTAMTEEQLAASPVREVPWNQKGFE